MHSLVSDRAKALIKLAETGLSCLSIPDVFHLLHDLSKSYSLAIFSHLRHAQQVLNQAQERLTKCQASPPSAAEVEQAQALVVASEAEVIRWQSVRSAYRSHLETLSFIVHPWHLMESTRQASAEVEGRLRAEIGALEVLLQSHGLAVKEKTLEKVRKQLAGLSALVDFWWQSVGQDLQQVALTPRSTNWRVSKGTSAAISPGCWSNVRLRLTRQRL